jgi:hypothetical protein
MFKDFEDLGFRDSKVSRFLRINEFSGFRGLDVSGARNSKAKTSRSQYPTT